MIDPTKAYDLVTTMMAAVTAHWPDTDADAGIIDPPARTYVNVGSIAWDCEQITASVEREFPTTGDLGSEQITSTNRLIELHGILVAVTVLRCVPTIDFEADVPEVPDPDTLDAAAQIILADRGIVYPAILAAVKAGELPACQRIAFDSWTAENESGGFGGGTTRLRMLVV